MRMGATAPPASDRLPPSPTLASEAKSTAPSSVSAAVPPNTSGTGMRATSTVIRGVPARTVSSLTGADVKRAVCPGRPPRNVAIAVDAIPDNPGSVEIAAGAAPGGLTTNCGSPPTGIPSRGVAPSPPRPGYVDASRVRLRARPVSLIGPSTVYRKAVDGTGPAPRRKCWNHSFIRVRVAVSGEPPSCPPLYQVTATTPPFAAMARAFASACSRPNRVSRSPCTRRVGAVMLPTTSLGLDRSSSACSSGVMRPVCAAWE